MNALLFLSLANFKTVAAPEGSGEVSGLPFDLPAMVYAKGGSIAVALVVALVLVLYLIRVARPGPAVPTGPVRPWILVDGSNVMHWQDNAPQLAPLRSVIERLEYLGYAPGVVFDANAGWKLYGRYVRGDELARLLGLPREQVFVVPKGEQADPYLLEVAREHKARIVTNDRFRDRADVFPEVLQPGLLVGGGWKDGKVELRGLDRAPEIARAG